MVLEGEIPPNLELIVNLEQDDYARILKEMHEETRMVGYTPLPSVSEFTYQWMTVKIKVKLKRDVFIKI